MLIMNRPIFHHPRISPSRVQKISTREKVLPNSPNSVLGDQFGGLYDTLIPFSTTRAPFYLQISEPPDSGIRFRIYCIRLFKKVLLQKPPHRSFLTSQHEQLQVVSFHLNEL